MSDPRAGQPATSADLVDVAEAGDRVLHGAPRPGGPRAARGVRHERPPRIGVHARASTRTTSSPRPRRSASTARRQGIDGPLFLGADTHALSEPATVSALEVLLANGVDVLVDSRGGYTPTPSVSRAILVANAGGATRRRHLRDAVAQPAADGGFKYNPPDGGPAGTDITGWIQDRANELLRAGLDGVKRVSLASARAGHLRLPRRVRRRRSGAVVDLDAIRSAGVRIGADPLGGASVGYWGAIGERYGLDLTVVNPDVDPTFRFMTLDWDGKIRMDCSSPYGDGRASSREQARLRHRHRQRHRLRPPRHRHAGRRADEPQPLPGGGDRLPVRAPRRLAGRTPPSARRW